MTQPFAASLEQAVRTPRDATRAWLRSLRRNARRAFTRQSEEAPARLWLPAAEPMRAERSAARSKAPAVRKKTKKKASTKARTASRSAPSRRGSARTSR